MRTVSPLYRVVYDVRQAGRLAWFFGHALIARHLSTPVLDDVPDGLPDRQSYLADLRDLLHRDRAHIEAGRYALPNDGLVSPERAFRQTTRFLADLGRFNLRRLRRDGREVWRKRRDDQRGRPPYYLQNFHYQTDGWLSDHSADLYDFQVDVLFNGATDAMRRQALLPIGDFLNSRRIAELHLLDVACGTGRFLRSVKQTFPRLPITGLDLSPPYLDRAKTALRRWSWATFVEAAAEKIPLADGSIDIVTSVYLLHELPNAVRRQVAAEMARVLRPGGRLVLVDSLQLGDHPPFDGLLAMFPALYHEPYYRNYLSTDLVHLFAQFGLATVQIDRAFMSKILVCDKPM